MGESERFWSILRLLFDVRRVERRVAVGLLIGTLCIVGLLRSEPIMAGTLAPTEHLDTAPNTAQTLAGLAIDRCSVAPSKHPTGGDFAANCEAPSF